MIEGWKAAGRPLDGGGRHPFSVWAKVVGGILRVNGFRDFLGNYGVRKTADDPLRQSLGFLGSNAPDGWLPAADGARSAWALGLVKAVIPPADQGSEPGRQRGVGVVLSAHAGETFEAETADRGLTLRLEKRRARFGCGEPHVRYQFSTVEEREIPLDV